MYLLHLNAHALLCHECLKPGTILSGLFCFDLPSIKPNLHLTHPSVRPLPLPTRPHPGQTPTSARSCWTEAPTRGSLRAGRRWAPTCAGLTTPQRLSSSGASRLTHFGILSSVHGSKHHSTVHASSRAFHWRLNSIPSARFYLETNSPASFLPFSFLFPSFPCPSPSL